MNEWDWVIGFAVVGAAFLFGRWCGIRAFEKELYRQKYECEHGIDSRDAICPECEVMRVYDKHKGKKDESSHV